MRNKSMNNYMPCFFFNNVLTVNKINNVLVIVEKQWILQITCTDNVAAFVKHIQP